MDALSILISSLTGLPGVGPKSAQRIAFYLLQHRKRGSQLSRALDTAMTTIQHCKSCNNYTINTLPICHLCSNLDRDATTLCIVENPTDIHAIEQSQVYHGHYFVLMGRLSPLDGMGPQEIHIPQLEKKLQSQQFKEVILALSPSPEGQATTYFLCDLLLKTQLPELKITQLARGVPFGGELNLLDVNTIGSALQNRASLPV